MGIRRIEKLCLLIGVFEIYTTHITYLLGKRHEQF